MRFQDHIIEETKKAAAEAFRYAVAVPEDKVEWSPLDNGRSVLDQAREMAKCPVWAYAIISGGPMPAPDEAVMAQQKAEMDAWKTIDVCKAECETQLEKLYELYATVTDERLAETKWLPFDGGRDFTYKEMMDYPRWNFNWHAGQIAYVQTLYGDKDMH